MYQAILLNFNCMSVLLIFIATYVRYNFTHMSRAISSHFSKYFCDIYSKYITLCAVMTYATSTATHPTKWII
jgi:hypothetical protein